MERYSDRVPLNARITINYDLAKPKVTFDYPVEKSRNKWIASFICPVVFVFYNFFIFFPSYLIYTIIQEVRNGCPNLSYATGTPIEWSEVLLSLYSATKIFFTFFFLCFVIPIIASYVIGYNYEHFKIVFPKFQFFVSLLLGGKKKCHTFNVESLTEPVFEIPLFKNVVLSYELEGEFAGKINRVEIREHDFQYGGEKEQWLWRATFYFNGIPRSGHLKGKFI